MRDTVKLVGATHDGAIASVERSALRPGHVLPRPVRDQQDRLLTMACYKLERGPRNEWWFVHCESQNTQHDRNDAQV
jgi:hypothetical protein